MHIKYCGGEYVKVKEPEGFGEKKSGKGAKRKPPATGIGLPSGNRPISDWLKKPTETSSNSNSEQVALRKEDFASPTDVCPAVAAVLNGSGRIVGEEVSMEPEFLEKRRGILEAAALRRLHVVPPRRQAGNGVIVDLVSPTAVGVTCPVCGARVSEDNTELNSHIDACLGQLP
jgi:hypothetical protein